MLRTVFFGRAVRSVAAAFLCGRMRRAQVEKSGFILLFALWYHALMDGVAIVREPRSAANKLCADDSLPTLLVNSTVTEFFFVSGVPAQRPFGQDFLVGYGGLHTLLRCFQSQVLRLVWVPAGTRPCPAGGVDVSAIGGSTLWILD